MKQFQKNTFNPFYYNNLLQSMSSHLNVQSPSKSYRNKISQLSQSSKGILHREPFYLSLRVDKLVFTQGSVLKSLVERWNEERKASFSKKTKRENSDFEDMFRNENQNKAVFVIELYQVNNQNEEQEKVSQSVVLGQVNNISATTKLYQYPIDLTQMSLKPKSQLSSFVYHYSPQSIPQLNLIVHMQLAESPEHRQLIGQCRLDPNLFIEMFLDEGINCMKDCRKIMKRIDSSKQIDQQVEIMFEMTVGRDRMQVELARKESKKGINVMDFKQHIRQILKEKEYLELQEANPQEEASLEQPQSQGQNQSENKSQRPKKSALYKYMAYLNRHVESQLQYFNPQKDNLQKEVNKLFTQRKLGAEKMKAEAQKIKKLKKQDIPKQDKSEQKLSHTPQTPTLSGNQTENKLSQTIKIVIFVVVSAILLYFSMTPTTKVPKNTIDSWEQID